MVLEDISLSFEANCLSGIMGPNGAGKTTCFNVLTSRYRPDRGRVLFDGADITGLPPRRIAAKGIARSFQTMNLFDDFTALENVVLALPEIRALGINMTHDLSRDGESLDRAAEPRLLFLDEPTSGLGSDAKAALTELIAEIRRTVTIVLIEHDMAFLFALAEQIYVVHWGQVIARGAPAELRRNPWVQASNLGRLA